MIIYEQWQKMHGESDLAYQIRVSEAKEQIGTWEDVAEICNKILGYQHTESWYRKQFDAFKRMSRSLKEVASSAKAVEEEAVDPQSIEEQRRSILKERVKLSTEKLEYSRWLREEARDELVAEKICAAVRSLDPMPAPKAIKEIAPGRKEYLFAFGDCHYGIEFEHVNLRGDLINEYSPEIFEDRMDEALARLLDVVRKDGIKELHVWELGDGIQGMLRVNSQLMKLRYGILDSAIRYADYLSQWLNELSKHVRVSFQMVVDSNHNQLRLLGQPKNAFSEENVSKVIALFIKERLKDNPNVNFIENPTGANYAEIAGYKVLGVHGEMKASTTAVSEYGLLYDEKINYLVYAHVHHRKQEDVGMDCETLAVRSVMGTDDYAMSLRRTSPAGCSLFAFEPHQGKVCEWNFNLNFIM